MANEPCVQIITQDPVAGIWDVDCFCGWEAATGYDEREDALRAWEHHRDTK